MAHSSDSDAVLHDDFEELMQIQRVLTQCPICADPVFGAAGRGYCPDCFVTFPLPKQSRKDLMSAFLQRYYMSKNSPFYHRSGCKYLKNIDSNNLIEISEPQGKPCRCIGL